MGAREARSRPGVGSSKITCAHAMNLGREIWTNIVNVRRNCYRVEARRDRLKKLNRDKARQE